MHGKLASLAEGAIATREVTLERLLLSMNVGVLLQVLGQRERLETQDADVLLDRRVRCDVATERESGCVGLVTAGDFAFVGSFHIVYVTCNSCNYVRCLVNFGYFKVSDEFINSKVARARNSLITWPTIIRPDNKFGYSLKYFNTNQSPK